MHLSSFSKHPTKHPVNVCYLGVTASPNTSTFVTCLVRPVMQETVVEHICKNCKAQLSEGFLEDSPHYTGPISTYDTPAIFQLVELDCAQRCVEICYKCATKQRGRSYLNPGEYPLAWDLAEHERQIGNEAIKLGNWQVAIERYTAALKLDPGMTAARTNRALAHLKMRHYQDAAEDCSQVLALEPHNVKALLRRALAKEGLHQTSSALQDAAHALSWMPGNGEVQEMHLHQSSTGAWC